MRPTTHAAFLALALLAGVGIARAQEATPTPPVELATSAPVDALAAEVPAASLVQLAPGQEAVLTKPVIVPASADPEEVEAIADTAAQTQKAVASGDVPIEQATRPLEETPDSGAGGLAGTVFWLLSFFFGAYFRPQVVGRIRKAWPAGWPAITDRRERWMNAALQLAFFTAAFYLLHPWLPSTPQTIQMWLAAAGVGVAGGSTMKRAEDAPLIPPAAAPQRS